MCRLLARGGGTMQSENGPSVAVCSKTVDFQQSINQHRKTSPACCCHTLDIKLLHLGRAMQRRPESCTCCRWWFTVTENGKIAVCSTCISKLRRGGRKCMSFNTTNLSCHLKSCHRNKNVSCWLSCQGQPWEAGNYHISYRASLFFFFGTDTGTNSMTLISQWNTKRKQVMTTNDTLLTSSFWFSTSWSQRIYCTYYRHKVRNQLSVQRSLSAYLLFIF